MAGRGPALEGLDVRPEPDRLAVRVRLRVSAGASRSRVLGVHGGALKLAVAAAPERGKANREVLELVAGLLSLPASTLELVSGGTSPDKVVSIPLSPAEVARRIGAPASIPPAREAGTGRRRAGRRRFETKSR